MNDPTTPEPGPAAASTPPSAAPAAKTKVAENTAGLARVLLVVLVVTALLGGLYALVAMMSALSVLGIIGGFVVALLPVAALPLFLSIRASMALKRRGQGAIIRRLVSIALVLLTHLAIIGVVSEWVGRSSGDLIATSYLALEEVGGVPYISPMLRRAAKERNTLPLPGDDEKKANMGADGGPVEAAPASDGGPAPSGIQPAVTDPATKAPRTSDAGPAAQAEDPTPVVATSLSPRKEGGARVLFAASAGREAGGNEVVLAHSLYAHGAVQTRRLSLAAFRTMGGVRQIETAQDGHLAVLLTSGTVLGAAPAGGLSALTALALGTKVKTADNADAGEITAVRDVNIGPGGNLLAVVDVAASRGKAPQPALVSTTLSGSSAIVVRKRGDAIDAVGTESAPTAYDFQLRRGTGNDRFVVVETFVSGAPIRSQYTGTVFQMNPQRLLVGSTRAPAGLREVARTGATLVGIGQKTLQAFQDAVALADGRVLFDANFAEAGKEGWLFVATPGDAQAYALAPKLYPNGALWKASAPRARSLSAKDDVISFIGGNADESSLKRGTFGGTGTTVAQGATATAADGTASWRVLDFESVALSDTADWMLLAATVRGDDGKERGAILLANEQDLAAKNLEALVVEGVGTNPLSRLTFRQDRRDPLWLVAP